MALSPCALVLWFGLAAAPTAAQEFAPPPTPGWKDITQTASVSSSGGPAAPPPAGTPEELTFWEQLNKKVFSDLCSQLDLPVDAGVAAPNIAGVSGKLERKFGKYPDQTLALMDSVTVNLGAARSQPIATLADAAGSLGFSISGGLSISGGSMTVRPLHAKGCAGLKKFVNVLGFKTVLPLTARRLAGMEVGEIWRIPAQINATISPGVGVSPAPMPIGSVGVSVSLSAGDQRLSTLTLYRVSESELRLRVRVDRAAVVGFGAGASLALTPVSVEVGNLKDEVKRQLDLVVKDGLVGTPLKSDAVSQVTGLFSDYLSASLGQSYGQSKGARLMLELVLDPRDEKQMALLAKTFEAGSLEFLRELAKVARFGDFMPGSGDASGDAGLGRLESQWGGKVGATPSFAGADRYRSHSRGTSVKLPLLVSFDGSAGRGEDRLTVDGRPGDTRVYAASRSRNLSLINLPFVGTLIRRNSTRSIDIYDTEGSTAPAAGVTAVYQYMAGAVHGRGRALRKMLEEADDIMRLVGTKGEGENKEAAVPFAAVSPSGKIQKSMMMSFTLMCDEAAARDILAAPVTLVVKAFAASLEPDERDLFREALTVSTLAPDGSLRYDRDAAAAALGVDPDADAAEPCGLLCQLDYLSETAAELVADLADVRAEKDTAARSARFCRMMAGKGRSGLSYSDLMRVLVQLVDPKDVSADLTVHAGGKDVHYSFNAGGGEGGADAVRRIKQVQGRFGAPPALSD